MVCGGDAVRTLQDFVRVRKGQSEQLNFGVCNMGSSRACYADAYAGIKTTCLYRGTPQATTDLLGGQIDFVVMDASQTQEHVKAGKLRRARDNRHPRVAAFPDAPTMVEAAIGTTCCTPGRACNGLRDVAPRSSPPSTGRPRSGRHARGQTFFSRPTAPNRRQTPADFADSVKQELKRWEGNRCHDRPPKQ